MRNFANPFSPSPAASIFTPCTDATKSFAFGPVFQVTQVGLVLNLVGKESAHVLYGMNTKCLPCYPGEIQVGHLTAPDPVAQGPFGQRKFKARFI